MMGRGDKQIDVSTLRRLLPMWMRSAGFHVCFGFGEDKTAEDCMMVVSANIDTVRMCLSRMLHSLTITDGCIAYDTCNIKGTVLIRVWEGEEDG